MTTSNSTNSTPEQTAAQYVEQQLATTQRSLKITRIVTSILVLVVVGYSVGITAWLHHNVLQPAPAADIVTARVVDVVQQSGSALSDQIVQEVPAALAALPDMVLNQMPHYRTQLEERFEHTLAEYGRVFEPEVEAFAAHFLNENRDHVEAILNAAQDPKATKQFGDQLEHELLGYLKTPNDRGESAMDLLDQGRAALEDVQTRLHRLASAKDLTPEELKLRRIVATALKTADAKL